MTDRGHERTDVYELICSYERSVVLVDRLQLAVKASKKMRCDARKRLTAALVAAGPLTIGDRTYSAEPSLVVSLSSLRDVRRETP